MSKESDIDPALGVLTTLYVTVPRPWASDGLPFLRCCEECLVDLLAQSISSLG